MFLTKFGFSGEMILSQTLKKSPFVGIGIISEFIHRPTRTKLFFPLKKITALYSER